jgi:hypothetical protein
MNHAFKTFFIGGYFLKTTAFCSYALVVAMFISSGMSLEVMS